MNYLLLFFAFPIAIIIFSVVLQKLLHNSITVAALVFAVFIVITFAFFDQNFLIATFGYTILSFLTAIISNGFYRNTNNNTTTTITNEKSSSNTLKKDIIDDEDNVINNCGYMYNRRCKKF